MMTNENLEEKLKEMIILPWQFFKLNNQDYLMKLSTNSNSYCLILTDLDKIYIEYLLNSEIEKKFKELNSDLEMPLSRILLQLQKDLLPLGENDRKQIIDLYQKDDKLKLRSESDIAGVPFLWIYNFTEYDKTLMREQLLQPLINIVAELQQRQLVLIALIKKKDSEIENYKKQGITVSRKYLETKPFNEYKVFEERNDPQILLETARNSMKYTFNKTNDEFYKAMVSANTLLEEQNKEVNIIQDNKEDNSDNCINNELKEVECNSEDNEQNLEILKRKQLEQKLTTKAKKKKKKINL